MPQEAVVTIEVKDGYWNLGTYREQFNLPEAIGEQSPEPALQSAATERVLIAAINVVRARQGKAPLETDPKPPTRVVTSQAKPKPKKPVGRRGGSRSSTRAKAGTAPDGDSLDQELDD